MAINYTMLPNIDFDELIHNNYSSLQRVAVSYEANRALQEELTQDILQAIWQSLKLFRGDSSVKTYIFRIAHNRCARHVAKQVKQIDFNTNDFIEPIDSQEPESLLEQKDEINSLLMAIRALPMAQKQLITLSLEGFSYSEMAEIIGIKSNHIGVKLNRAKKLLKQFMEQKK